MFYTYADRGESKELTAKLVALPTWFSLPSRKRPLVMASCKHIYVFETCPPDRFSDRLGEVNLYRRIARQLSTKTPQVSTSDGHNGSGYGKQLLLLKVPELTPPHGSRTMLQALRHCHNVGKFRPNCL